MSSLDISNNNNLHGTAAPDPYFQELLKEKEAADELYFKETQKITNKLSMILSYLFNLYSVNS